MRTYALTSVAVEVVTEALTINEVIARKIDRQRREGIDSPFYVVDLNDVVKKYERWIALLPRVTPFYAVKALPDPAVVELLHLLGAGFDCASQSEIELVTRSGVDVNRIIYANTCKQPDMIRYAAVNGVDLMTFDNEDELHKIRRLYPNARLVLRILPPKAKKVAIDLGAKFGCPLGDVYRLLLAARKWQLNVVGISFHVGYGCTDAEAYGAAVRAAHEAFQTAQNIGYDLRLLDIGGGFPGFPGCGITIEEIVTVLGPALDDFFPAERGVRIVAEPGTFFVASAMHLAVQVIGRRLTAVTASELDSFAAPTRYSEDYRTAHVTDSTNNCSENVRAGGTDGGKIDRSPVTRAEYYINDGFYGSFCRGLDGARQPIPARKRCLDHSTKSAALLRGGGGDDTDAMRLGHLAAASGSRYLSIIYGPTCDGADVVMRDAMLPELEVGDWLVFAYMGHYTITSASPFNGMPRPGVYYIQMTTFESTFSPHEDELCGSAGSLAAASVTETAPHDDELLPDRIAKSIAQMG